MIRRTEMNSPTLIWLPFILLSRHAEAFKISKAFIIISPPFFRAILSFEPSEPPSLICLLQVPRRASLCLKRKHPCGLPAAPRRKDRLHKRSANCLPITDTVILSSHPEGCQVLSVKLKVSSQAHVLLKKSVKGIKTQNLWNSKHK
uniref:Secreted protein n=1 Tax=Takifugu rubripes TaxID=31033 RepID=A0A674N160_TAKRU